MGHYLNPGNEGFKRALRARIYVDKSEMIEYVNSVLGTDEWDCIFREAKQDTKAQKLYLEFLKDVFTEFAGFTEEEVKKLCRRFDRDFNEVKRWYDGYKLWKCWQVVNAELIQEHFRTI